MSRIDIAITDDKLVKLREYFYNLQVADKKLLPSDIDPSLLPSRFSPQKLKQQTSVDAAMSECPNQLLLDMVASIQKDQKEHKLRDSIIGSIGNYFSTIIDRDPGIVVTSNAGSLAHENENGDIKGLGHEIKAAYSYNNLKSTIAQCDFFIKNMTAKITLKKDLGTKEKENLGQDIENVKQTRLYLIGLRDVLIEVFQKIKDPDKRLNVKNTIKCDVLNLQTAAGDERIASQAAVSRFNLPTPFKTLDGEEVVVRGLEGTPKKFPTGTATLRKVIKSPDIVKDSKAVQTKRTFVSETVKRGLFQGQDKAASKQKILSSHNKVAQQLGLPPVTPGGGGGPAC